MGPGVKGLVSRATKEESEIGLRIESKVYRACICTLQKGTLKKYKTLNFTTIVCWIVAMNKKNIFAEFRIKISSSSLSTFYDNFRLI